MCGRYTETAAGKVLREYFGRLFDLDELDDKGFAPRFNARAETLAGKPAYNGAFERRRCLVLALSRRSTPSNTISST